tara:strand:+ start:1545 stop:2078 length:534 start_codon:yes stop_codon:yes gene_type:complete
MLIFNKSKIPDVITFNPIVYKDDRGCFMETYNKEISNYLQCDFVQDNYVKSNSKNIIRGLHFQKNEMQAKLLRVIKGEIFDVAVDLRKESPTYKEWVGIILSEHNGLNIYIPKGFAHGYCTLTDNTEVMYKCSNYYNPSFETGIIWNDSSLKIDWPINNPILSSKDSQLPQFNNIEL